MIDFTRGFLWLHILYRTIGQRVYTELTFTATSINNRFKFFSHCFLIHVRRERERESLVSVPQITPTDIAAISKAIIISYPPASNEIGPHGEKEGRRAFGIVYFCINSDYVQKIY